MLVIIGCFHLAVAFTYTPTDRGALSESRTSATGSVSLKGERATISSKGTGTMDIYTVIVPSGKTATVTLKETDYYCVGGVSYLIVTKDDSKDDLHVGSKGRVVQLGSANSMFYFSVGGYGSRRDGYHSAFTSRCDYSISVSYSSLPNQVLVEFNANGGEVSPASKFVSIDTAVGTLPTPTRVGYAFDGWYTSASAGTKINSSTIVSSAVTYFAHWTQQQVYTVIFDANGGSGYMSPQICTASVDTQLKKCTFTRDNYTFLGWALNDPTRLYASYDDCDYVNFINAAGKTYTLYAVWEKNPEYVTVKFIAPDNWGGNPDPDSRTYLVGGSYYSFPYVARYDGYNFIGWFTEEYGGLQVRSGDTVTSDITKLYAHWEAIYYTVMFETNGGIGGMSSQLFLPGEVAKLKQCTLVRPAGKKFAGWRRADNGRRYDDGILVFNLAEPGEIVTLTAIWEDE